MTVRISAVTPDDGGVYLCGVWIYRHSYSYSIINTVHLHIMAKVGVSRATGQSGGRMMIKCEHPQYKTKPKYICKESDGCSERKNPGVQDEWMENGDVSLYDDTRAGVLMVFFRELKAADAGTYRCGVNVSHYTESFTELQLDVRDDATFVTESAHLGEEVNITCQIPEEHKVHFCKDDDNHICQNIRTSAVTEMSPSSERNEERVFTVSISNVSVRDAGVYWCGAETRDTHLTFISLTTKIQLDLFTKVGVSKATGHSGGRMMIKCEHPQYKTKPKYICKESDGCSERKNPGVQDEWMENGDVSLYDDTRAGVLMVFFRELKAADAGTYRCGVNVSHYTESFTELQLDVRDDVKYPKTKTESAHLGEEVNITCQIPEEHKVHFCKDDDNHICQNIRTSTVTEMSPSSERNEERVFTVSISNVSVRDAGVYWCGAETRDTHLTFISLTTKIQLNLFIKVGVSRATGQSGGRMMIKCEHPQHKTKPKYIRKDSDGCSERKNPGVQDEWMENGDVSLYDDTRAGVLMVFFRELKAADAGTYRCGVNVSHYTESFTELQLDVRDDVTFVTESAHLGEEVNITCQIPEEHKVHFCKDDDNHICQNISTSAVTEMSPSSERNEERVFTVSISNVSVRDAGVYWCGAETRDTHLTFISLTTKIQLNLFMAPVVRREGESAEIFCPYDSIYKSKSKSLCKGKCSTRDRNTLNETVREEKETKTDRLTLNDDVTASVFTGTITGLRAEDAGKYWCAVTLERDVNYLYTHLIVIMNEDLNLTKYEGDDMSIQCKHHDELQKCFCKAHEPSMCVKDGVSLEKIRDDRFSFSDEASTGVFTVNITDLREEDSGIYWCGAHIITKVNLEVKKNFSDRIVISCVCVSLLLIGASVLLLYKLRYIKPRDQHSSTDGTEMSSGKAPQAVCEYENIRDVRQRLASGTGDDVLYSNAKLSTDSSDLNHTLYSTVQLPTTPSDGLLYASVRFQKHKESLSDAKVTFNNEEIYSAVSHRERLD
ncbi:obscurin isoform X3 [Siphateles boraxobius]|uniref:obscurin isoform X3 n=1 Tax=Siphateles boraxobius TaxID=180520 RepID=UPI004062CB52